MSDVHSKEQRRHNMSRIRDRDTRPEMTIRRGLHARGFRFRLHGATLPGKPDLVFRQHRAVIFVNGCFWHGHTCRRFRWPKTQAAYWQDKINGNRERDVRVRRKLRKRGWRVLTVWECSTKGPGRLSDDDLMTACTIFLLDHQKCQSEVTGRKYWVE